jgi:hypothetical protein
VIFFSCKRNSKQTQIKLEANKMSKKEEVKEPIKVNAFGEWDDADADEFFANYLANKKQTKKQ